MGRLNRLMKMKRPSEILRGWLADQNGLTQSELADQLGTSRYSVNQILNDRRSITAEMALRLERVTELEASLWLHAQTENDLAAARRAQRGTAT